MEEENNEVIEQKSYEFELTRPYLVMDNFKQKSASVIEQMISAGRLCKMLKFEGYGRADFEDDDKQCIHPCVTIMDKFNRIKTNCLVFDMVECAENKGYYDKCFIYHSNGKHIGWYGFIFLNTETGESTQTHFIDDLYDDLIQSMTKAFNTMKMREIYKLYRKKYDAAQEKGVLNIPPYKEFEKLFEDFKNVI